MTTERDFELAETLATAERESGVARIVNHLHEAGSSHCEDCGEVIPRERRQVAPWARRCVTCQKLWERGHA